MADTEQAEKIVRASLCIHAHVPLVGLHRALVSAITSAIQEAGRKAISDLHDAQLRCLRNCLPNNAALKAKDGTVCVCGHAKKHHQVFEDHDECLMCVSDDPCSEFQAPPVDSQIKGE